MGLLSDQKTREKIVVFIKQYNNKLSFLCYVTGLVWFLALAHAPLNAKTYFSENALIPGLVESQFYNDHGAAQHYADLKDVFRELKEKVDATPANSRDESLLYKMPTVWLESRFRALGLDTYVHNYSFLYPMAIMKDQKFHGQNVYAILRAPKAASTEAIVLSVPFRSMHSEEEKTAAGIALMLGLAKAFRSKTYWAKDIIFLVTEHEGIGMQAWLSAYHYSKLTDYIIAGELPARSGAIQAAINLELGTDQINRLNIKLEGLNGQLPNLDLVNTVNRLCKKEGITTTLQKRMDFPGIPYTMDAWQYSAKTMLQMMWHQASMVQTGNHGLFHRYHIEAVTLQGIKLKTNKNTAGFTEIGRMLEGIFRSLNNLMERFHQSFFFYLLPATERYVSIGLYMPPFGLLAAPILIKAIALWIAYSFEEDICEKKTTTSKKEALNGSEEVPEDAVTNPEKEPTAGDEKEMDVGQSGDKVKEKDMDMYELPATGFSSVVPPILMSLAFGLGVCYAPDFFVNSASALQMSPGEGLAMGALAIFVASLTYPRILKRKIRKASTPAGPNWKLLKCLGLLLLGAILGATALLNISLAFLITAVWTPVMVMVQPTKSRMGNLLQYVVLPVVSPMVLLYLAALGYVYTWNLVADKSDLLAVHTKTWESVQTGLLHAVVGAYFYNNWIYSMVTVLYFPTWLIFWSLLWATPY